MSGIRDWGLTPGRLTPGPRNAITDVPGVTVGHYTLNDDKHHTGVTVIVPRPDVFLHKCVAAGHVINGYGKTAGLVQVQELGTLETPIALTNTLNVGKIHDALVGYTVQHCAELGEEVHSANPVVGECNDSGLNYIMDRPLGEAELLAALQAAGQDVPQGCVGAGMGMICHGLKGGIGTASRIIDLDGQQFTLGVLTLCNHGRLDELNICGRKLGTAIEQRMNERGLEVDKGSCMIIVATDLPVSSRQLGRILRRTEAGLARVGSYYGHGSGDIAIGFTTAFDIPENSDEITEHYDLLRERRLEEAFLACAEATEEAVLNALASATTLTGYTGKTTYALNEFKDLL